ncbi:MAG: hypothetical protein ACM30E_09235 [Nitrososphaerales archaeon]
MTLTSRRFVALGLVCLVLAATILLLMPLEKTLGQVIKIVYLHGALSRAGMIGLVGAGITGVLFLVTRRPSLAAWTRGLLLSGWVFWVAHFIVSMPATRLTWGPWIAWGEPRVTMTLQLMAAGLVVLLISWLVKDDRFTAAAAALLALAVAWLAFATGVIRHPLDPIGSSPSITLQLIYLALLVPVLGGMVLVAWWLANRAHPEGAVSGRAVHETR